MTAMKMLAAKVVDDKIVPDRPQLTPSEERELAEALADIRAGRFVDGRQLVADLKARAHR